MLRVENLAVNYGMINAVRGVNFEVNQGEIVSLIGANGAGKSTILRTVSGLIKPASGTLTYEGQNITKTNAQKIVQLGISHVPEGRHVFKGLSVRENLEMGAFLRKDRANIEEDIEAGCFHPIRWGATDASHGTGPYVQA